MFDENMIFRIPAMLIALTVHEYAHARVAVELGDSTPRLQGRLTLNPIAHLDPIGLIMLWLVQFGWAKPVEVNARNFDNWRKGMMYVSLAGPGANLVTAFVSILAATICLKFGIMEDWLMTTLQLTFTYNVIFAVFNLMPIPPLDGSKVLVNYLPRKIAYQYESFERYGTFVLLALVYLGVAGFVLNPLIYGVMGTMMKIVRAIV